LWLTRRASDRSLEIATAAGAKVVQFDFNGHWPKKKNWALDHLPFSHDWVLIVDCDERITPELWDEIETAIQQTEFDGYYLNRRVFFSAPGFATAANTPTGTCACFATKRAATKILQTADIPNTGDNEVHEHVMIDGPVGYLKHDMLHEDFRDLYHWLARHNRYSNWEAQVYYNLLTGMGDGGTIGASLFGDAVQRKRFFKENLGAATLQTLLRFMLFYILQLGFLDGRAGYIYGRLLSQYEYQIGVKLFELRQFGGQLNVTPPAEKPAPTPNSSVVSSSAN
jgi:glycosyltransferase involved in cell wall biosynthesis